MENKEIARLLWETADLMEIAGEDSFRIRSYRNGATAVEGYPERIADILKDPERKVTDIPGIGKGLAFVLERSHRARLLRAPRCVVAEVPSGRARIPQDPGPRSEKHRAAVRAYRIGTIDELERLCLDQKLRMLPRMGAKLEEKVLKSIAQYRQRTGRYLLSYAEDMAGELTAYLGETPGIEQITPAGSLRRGRETVGDLDLLVTGPAAAEVLERFVRFPQVEEVLARGENKASAKVGREGLQVDLRALPRESFGAALQYFTGSKDHNVALRTRAVKMGFKLSEYGLYRSADDTRVAGETEARSMKRWGSPGFRRSCAKTWARSSAPPKAAFPSWWSMGKIRGDLHMHTTETDGRASLEEMAAAARERGYEYIAITDHSKSLAMTNGLDEARAVDFARTCAS